MYYRLFWDFYRCSYWSPVTVSQTIQQFLPIHKLLQLGFNFLWIFLLYSQIALWLITLKILLWKYAIWKSLLCGAWYSKVFLPEKTQGTSVWLKGNWECFRPEALDILKNQQKFAPLKIQHIIELVTDHTVFSFGFIFK